MPPGVLELPWSELPASHTADEHTVDSEASIPYQFSRPKWGEWLVAGFARIPITGRRSNTLNSCESSYDFRRLNCYRFPMQAAQAKRGEVAEIEPVRDTVEPNLTAPGCQATVEPKSLYYAELARAPAPRNPSR